MHDLGNGVLVPEGDWLVPMEGDTSLTVELEMPGWSQPDMVQVRACTQDNLQTIVLGVGVGVVTSRYSHC